MGWQYAYHGYQTDHGGVLVTTQTTHTVDGIPNLRMGDVSYCPKCMCNTVIIHGDTAYILYGKPAAYVGGSLSCGAKILPGSVTRSFRAENGGSSSSSTVVAVPTGQPHFIRYLILSEDGTAFLQNHPYTIEINGKTYSGTTDAQGYTEVIKEQQPYNTMFHEMYEGG